MDMILNQPRGRSSASSGFEPSATLTWLGVPAPKCRAVQYPCQTGRPPPLNVAATEKMTVMGPREIGSKDVAPMEGPLLGEVV
jgi:hypothetical protein